MNCRKLKSFVMVVIMECAYIAIVMKFMIHIMDMDGLTNV